MPKGIIDELSPRERHDVCHRCFLPFMGKDKGIINVIELDYCFCASLRIQIVWLFWWVIVYATPNCGNKIFMYKVFT